MDRDYVQFRLCVCVCVCMSVCLYACMYVYSVQPRSLRLRNSLEDPLQTGGVSVKIFSSSYHKHRIEAVRHNIQKNKALPKFWFMTF